MTNTPTVAIITGASRGIGAGLVSVFRDAGYAVVGTALTIEPAEAADFVTVSGYIAAPATADHIVTCALNWFGRIDTLVNNAGIFIGKSFTKYMPEDYAAMIAVNLTGFFHITQRAMRLAELRAAGEWKTRPSAGSRRGTLEVQGSVSDGGDLPHAAKRMEPGEFGVLRQETP
jgi:NAD(P)-dependent dehydrogenase (short-subunit alcohol dehydrogenase family)